MADQGIRAETVEEAEDGKRITRTRVGEKDCLDVKPRNDASDPLIVQQTGLEDVPLEISLGNVPGYRKDSLIGFGPTVSSTERTLWPLSGTLDVVYPSAAVPMLVSSDNVNDNGAGTGAREVLINGLDVNFNEIAERVTLTGQTAVSTLNQYRRVNKMIVTEAGGDNENAGGIYIGTGLVTGGVPAVIHNYIEPGVNISRSCFYTVPNGKKLIITSTLIGPDAGKYLTTAFVTTSAVTNNIPIRTVEGHTVTGNYTAPSYPASAIAAGTDIEIKASFDTGTGPASAFIAFILVDDDIQTLSTPLAEEDIIITPGYR